MTFRDKFKKVCEFPELENLEQARELRDLQWDVIVELIKMKNDAIVIGRKQAELLEKYEERILKMTLTPDSGLKN